MNQIQSLVYLMSMFIPLFIGITLLIVWHFDVSQKFVRDFALSTISSSFFILSYIIYFQNVQPYAWLGYGLAVIFATLNLLFLVTSVNNHARFNQKPKYLISLGIFIFIAMACPPSFFPLIAKSILVMLFQVVLGIVSIARLWKHKSNERFLGPLVLLLGLSQLILILSGTTYIHIQAIAASLIRVVIGFLFLFSALQRSKGEIKKVFNQFQMMTEQSPQGVLVVSDAHILYANKAAQKIYAHANIKEMYEGGLFAADNSKEYEEFNYFYQQLQQKHIEVATWSGKRRRHDGKILSLTFTAWSIEWGDLPAVQILITDETELIDSAIALQHQETHDELTGLPNRRLLVQQLNDYCYTDQHHATCMLTILNINRFKLFNQGKGHVIGDKVLLEFANKLKNNVGSGTEVMRLGGDEFGLVSVDVSDIKALNTRLTELCKQPIHIAEVDYFINVAMGQALYPVNALNADGLLRAANAAMHQAKKIPGTSLVAADSRFEESLSRAMEQEQTLKSAIVAHEICLYYQPKVNSQTHQLIGFEALARWFRPDIGFVSPIEFIAVAEKTALISELGTMLLSDACRQIAAWRNEFGDCVPVAVNVSPIQLLNPNFVKLISGLISEFAIPARLLTLEITENAAINDLEQTQIQINQLRDLGVAVAMDDFGTGYSSLSMLRQLRVHTLKIDRALIAPLPSADAMAIVISICQLAKALNMHVVAEGVETVAQSEAALAAGCHELQGYLFSKPVAHHDAGLWLKRWVTGKLQAVK